jgi:hypothetical protein
MRRGIRITSNATFTAVLPNGETKTGGHKAILVFTGDLPEEDVALYHDGRPIEFSRSKMRKLKNTTKENGEPLTVRLEYLD